MSSCRKRISRRSKDWSGDRAESGLSPEDGFAIPGDHAVLVQFVGLDELVAGGPLAVLVVFEPREQAALGVGYAVERVANLLTQREGWGELFHGNLEHGREQAEHAEQVLLGGVEGAVAGGDLTESAAEEGHAEQLGGLIGAQFTGDGEGGDAAEGLLTHREEGRLDGPHLLANGAHG